MSTELSGRRASTVNEARLAFRPPDEGTPTKVMWSAAAGGGNAQLRLFPESTVFVGATVCPPLALLSLTSTKFTDWVAGACNSHCVPGAVERSARILPVAPVSVRELETVVRLPDVKFIVWAAE